MPEVKHVRSAFSVTNQATVSATAKKRYVLLVVTIVGNADYVHSVHRPSPANARYAAALNIWLESVLRILRVHAETGA